MKTATIEEARERLPELIEAARSGEEVEITEGGRAVAVLKPTADARFDEFRRDHADESERIARLIEQGVLRASKGGRKPDLPPPGGDGRPGLLGALIEERRTGR
jgi:prevent-host-death family protein